MEAVKKVPAVKELTDFISSKVAVQLLELFSDRPEAEMYQREILDEMRSQYNPKLTTPSIKKWLDFFVQNGILSEKKKKKWVLYSLNKGNPVVKQLRIFLNVTRLYGLIKNFDIDDAEIYLFGSTARGEDSENSDIDLLVIGKIDDDTRSNVRLKILDKGKKEVNFVVYSKGQYSDLYRNDKAFYDSIERDKIRLL
jgi:predicted nucleotidyltransferase